MSGFGNAGRLLFSAACGKIRIPCAHGRLDSPVYVTGPSSSSELGPLLTSFRCLSVTPTNEKLKAFRVEENLGLTPPPPKPMAPFLRWAKENRPKLMSQSPSKDFTGFGQFLGKTWSTMSEEDKKPYVKTYEQDLSAYKEKREKYLASLSESDKDSIAKARRAAFTDRRAKKEKIAVKKKMRELEKPRKPMTAFMLYMTQRRKQLVTQADPKIGASMDNKEQMKKIGQEWRAMSAADKVPYGKEYEEALSKYHAALEEWEREMVAAGHPEYVRVATRARLDEKGQVRRGKKPRRKAANESEVKAEKKVSVPVSELHSSKRSLKKTQSKEKEA